MELESPGGSRPHPLHGKLSIEDFQFCGILGEGQFGRVMMARNIKSQEIVAVKVLRKGFLVQKGSRTISHAISEKQVLQEMADKRHPYIVSLQHSFQDDQHLYLVMDFIGGGDLFSLIEKKGRLPEAWARIYSAEIALALNHLHEAGVIYRDLKPENVMVAITGHLKLTDFGFAKKMKGAPLARGSCVGTPEYMAPELLQGREYGVAVDWWTLGCLLYEMITGRGPFGNDDLQLLVKAITSTDPTLPSRTSAECAAAIRGLMSRQVQQRIDFDRIREAPFYEGLDWEALFRMEVPAPYTPVDTDVDSDMSSHAEQRAWLQAEFGEVWSSATGNSTEFDDAHSSSTRGSTSLDMIISNPMVMSQGGGAASALAMELTADGTIWRISSSLAELFGFSGVQGHLLFGLNFIHNETGQPPCIDPATSAPFTEAFRQILARLEAGNTGTALTPISGVVEHKPVRVILPGADSPVFLLFAFDETAKLTDHSVALRPTHEGHAAITVAFADVSAAELAKELVRRRIETSFNEKLEDELVAALFSPAFSFNAAGTQVPARQSAASLTPVARYLQRRELLVRAFPDLHYDIADQSASDERVVTSWAWAGTHNGPLHFEVDGEYIDIPPTGRRVLIHGVSVDVCSGGLITDHAAYFDAGAITRQIRQRGDGLIRTPQADDGGVSAEEEGPGRDDPQERAAKALMDQFYTRKVLSLLATACNDLGFAICRGCPDALVSDKACGLPIAVSSVGFARALGLQGPRPGLNTHLLEHIIANVDTRIQPDVLDCVHSLRDAMRFGRPAKQIVTVQRADRPHALIVNLAPFEHEGLHLVAVVIVDVNADPNKQAATRFSRSEVGKECERGKEVDNAAGHYTWQHDLLNDLSLQPGAHLGFCADVLSAAIDAFDNVGFSLAVRNTPSLPMTWVSNGFLKLTGYARSQLINRNCNRLQTGATDPDATFRLSEAIRTGRAERVTLWNITADGVGFWNCLSMYPSTEYNGTVVQHYVAAQVRMPPEFYKRLVRVQRTVRAEMEREKQEEKEAAAAVRRSA